MALTFIRRAALAAALLAAAGCTVKNTEAPALTGPSGLALTLRVNAIPDSISQDGGSQSSVKVTAIGADGKALSGLPLRLDMIVNGVAQDYGTLSARSVVTNTDGVATAVYTAPPSPVNGVFGTCSSLPGNCVSIMATPTATNFTTANPEQVQIRLVPTGVVLPPAGAPAAAFTISPTPVNFNIASTFDASNSTPGTGASAISSYAWSFGDGSSAAGKTVTHTYTQSTTPGNSYNVTLTVTNDRSLSASTTQAVTVDASPAPTGDWVFSPTAPSVKDTVFFNASAVQPAAGHQITGYSWNFGDGTSATGVQTTHSFSAAASYVVVLTVTDDAGQRLVVSKPLSVGTGNPVAAITFSPSAPARNSAVNFNSAGSSTTGGATISTYAWDFGDGFSASTASPSHSFTVAGTYTVRLTVTDSQGRSGTTTTTVTVS
jgi:PKD repeat protein